MTKEQTEHYFDWAATSPCDREILTEALNETIEKWGNPSSIHSAGKEAREFFENARKRCASVLNVPAEKVYFTSGGTESDHIPILSVLTRPQKGTVLFSSIEHPAVREQACAKKMWLYSFFNSMRKRRNCYTGSRSSGTYSRYSSCLHNGSKQRNRCRSASV